MPFLAAIVALIILVLGFRSFMLSPTALTPSTPTPRLGCSLPLSDPFQVYPTDSNGQLTSPHEQLFPPCDCFGVPLLHSHRSRPAASWTPYQQFKPQEPCPLPPYTSVWSLASTCFALACPQYHIPIDLATCHSRYHDTYSIQLSCIVLPHTRLPSHQAAAFSY